MTLLSVPYHNVFQLAVKKEPVKPEKIAQMKSAVKQSGEKSIGYALRIKSLEFDVEGLGFVSCLSVIGISLRSTVVGGNGLEPMTSAMSTRRSNQLS
jgi:hypothetical protein